jgi:predicted dehydrogenase
MSMIESAVSIRTAPRLGFLGTGWIGLHRMQALAASGCGTVAAVADLSAARLQQAAAAAPAAVVTDSLDALLDMELDGIVIATPSGLHAEQAIRSLESGTAVFCQKPLARTAAETRAVIAAARAADRLLGVDLSYRHTAAMIAVRDAVRAGRLGEIHAVDLTFHNAYGPDSGWARDPGLAGGGCVIDLGIHLLDLALWTLDFPAVTHVHSQLHARGRRLERPAAECEDHAFAAFELSTGAALRLACSWEKHAGRDAVIAVEFAGTRGAAAMRNVNGSFHDFTAELLVGATATTLATPPDDWGGRAIIEWSTRLRDGDGFDPTVTSMVDVAHALDAVLGR